MKLPTRTSVPRTSEQVEASAGTGSGNASRSELVHQVSVSCSLKTSAHDEARKWAFGQVPSNVTPLV